MQRWLSRLSFSFFIVAAVLAWEIYNIQQGRRGIVPQYRVVLYYLGTSICVVLGMLGVKARHREID